MSDSTTSDHWLDRPCLLHRLDQASAAPRTTICAPAGYGKTALLDSWLTSRRPWLPTVTVALSPADEDRSTFWQTVLRAVQASRVVASDTPLGKLHPAATGPERFRRELVRAVDELEQPLLLVVDDLHHATDPEIAADLDAAVQRGRNLRLLATGRTRLPIASSRAHLAGELAEITAQDLAFTAEETSATLAALGLDPELVDPDELHAYTEGWPAAVRLIATDLQRLHEPTQVLRIPSVADALTRYVEEEVVAGRAEDEASFLLRTSVAGELSADLAAAICADADGKRLFDAFVAEGLLTPTSATSATFVPALLDALRHLRERTLAAENTELHRRAATWCQANGQIWPAVRHARATGDWPLAVDLLRTHWLTLVDAEPTEYVSTVATIPDDPRMDDPVLLVASAWAHDLAASEPHTIERFAQQAADVAERSDDPGLALLAASGTLIATSVSGDLDRAVEQGRAIAEELRSIASSGQPADLDDAAPFSLRLGLAQLQTGELADAARSLRFAQRSTHGFLRHAAHVTLTLTDALTGRATTTVSRVGGDDELVEAAAGDGFCDILAQIAGAITAAESGRAQLARRNLEGTMASRRNDVRDLPVLAYASALLHVLEGDSEVGLDVVQALQYALHEDTAPAFGRGLLACAKGELHVAQCQPGRALADLQGVGPDASHALCPASIRGRAFLSTREYGRALTAVAPCLELADAHAPRTLLDVLVTVAAAHLGGRDTEAAIDAFVRALGLAAVTHGRRPFLLLPRPTLRALLAHVHTVPLGPAAMSVCKHLAAEVAPLESRLPGLALSPRERLVVSYLATGATTKEIAEQLFVSPNTLKTQLRSTYRKLGVNSREAALDRARTTGLI